MRKCLLVIFIIGLAMNILGLIWPIGQDEGVFLAVAKQINHGFLPYRDIFDHKPPGLYYFLSIFTNFTNSPVTIRLLFLLINLLTCYMIYRIGRNRFSEAHGLLAAGLYLLILPLYEGHLILTEPLMSFFLVIGLYLYLLFLETKKNVMIFLVGASVGLAMLCKQPALINFVTILLLLITMKKWGNLKYLIFLMGGLVAVWLPWVGYYQYMHQFGGFWQQVIELNLTSYPSLDDTENVKRLALSVAQSSIVWFMTFGGLVGFVLAIWKKKYPSLENIAILTMAFIPIPILFYRQYPHYWLQVLPFICLVAVSFYHKTRFKYFLNILIIACGFLSLLNFVYTTLAIKVPQRNEQLEISEKVRNGTLITDKVYSNRVFTGLYFLADRLPVSRYLYVSEINENSKAQDSIIKSIKINKPKFIVWLPKNKQYKDSYTKAIGEQISIYYRPVARYPNTGLTLYRVSEQQ
ncbi:MAG: glycosyltransferase family 39 protein [bacterium]|nr:glycosyltransferase family 39 protein [bacterium]